VSALIMCCILPSPRAGRKGRRRPHRLSYSPGLPPAVAIPGKPDGDYPHGHEHAYIPEQPLELAPWGGGTTKIAGGVGGGGEAAGGEGGSGGDGGRGGDGGGGGEGGRGEARASASVPVYPYLMCCVFVRPPPPSPHFE
jgi:hypothetical protein